MLEAIFEPISLKCVSMLSTTKTLTCVFGRQMSATVLSASRSSSSSSSSSSAVAGAIHDLLPDKPVAFAKPLDTLVIDCVADPDASLVWFFCHVESIYSPCPLTLCSVVSRVCDGATFSFSHVAPLASAGIGVSHAQRRRVGCVSNRNRLRHWRQRAQRARMQQDFHCKRCVLLLS